jgi:hypothetical protein
MELVLKAETSKIFASVSKKFHQRLKTTVHKSIPRPKARRVNRPKAYLAKKNFVWQP